MFFSVRHLGAADQLADEVLDRMARRIAEGSSIETTPENFALGIARNVAREDWKRPQPRPQEIDWNRLAAPAPNQDEEAALRCLDHCLDQLSPDNRSSILRFYAVSNGREKISNRAMLARELGIDANALRVRMHRLRSALERCMRDCPQNGNELNREAISKRGRN